MGEDLTAWLAENVMEWSMRANAARGRPWYFGPNDEIVYWDPLHDDAQAMIVLQHMVVELGWEFRCGPYVLGPSKFWANFSRSPGSKSTQGNSLNSAICRAAKVAIEAERAKEPMTCAYCGSVLE